MMNNKMTLIQSTAALSRPLAVLALALTGLLATLFKFSVGRGLRGCFPPAATGPRPNRKQIQSSFALSRSLS